MLDEMSLEGMDGVECCYPFLVEWYGNKAGELRRLLDMHSLEISSYYYGGGYYRPEERERTVREVKRRSDFMAELRYENILLDGASKIPGLTEAEEHDYIRRIADTANELGAYAKSLGLTLSWHQHWGSFLEGPENFDRFMDLTDPDLVGFCADVSQMTMGGFDVPEAIERYASQRRIRFMHFKDLTAAGRPDGRIWPGHSAPSDDGAYGVDSRYRFVELGRGQVDFVTILGILQKYGYDGYLIDDFDYTGYDARISVRACKAYINGALGIRTERDKREAP
jgi:inosose dehydratase